MKVCRCCGKMKPDTAYYEDLRNRDGLYASCKECHKARANYKVHPTVALTETIAKLIKPQLEEWGGLNWTRLVKLLPKNNFTHRKALKEALAALNAEVDEESGTRIWFLRD